MRAMAVRRREARRLLAELVAFLLARVHDSVRDYGQKQAMSRSRSRNSGVAQGLSDSCIGSKRRREGTKCAGRPSKRRYMCERGGLWAAVEGSDVESLAIGATPRILLGYDQLRVPSHYRHAPACRSCSELDEAALMHAAPAIWKMHAVRLAVGQETQALSGDLHAHSEPLYALGSCSAAGRAAVLPPTCRLV